MGVIAEGILRGCQGLFTPVSLGYPLSVFNKNSTLKGEGNSLRKQETRTETYANSTCFPMFPTHVSETLKKKPSLIYLAVREHE